jgi:hypothetical protein
MIPNYYDPRDQRMPRGVRRPLDREQVPVRLPPCRVVEHRTPIQHRPRHRNHSHHHTNLGRMFWLWWKTLSGSYMVFTSTSRS